MSAAATTLALSGEMTVVNAAEHRLSLLTAATQASAQSQGLALDLVKVEALDSAGVQLLIATRKTLQAAGGHALRITNANSAVQDTLAIYSLQHWLTGESA